MKVWGTAGTRAAGLTARALAAVFKTCTRKPALMARGRAAVLLAVLKHRSLLGRHYRLAFYEDLHYASDPVRRERGLGNLKRLLGDALLHRVAWPLDAAQQAAKLRLVRLHASQLTPQINTLAAYTPALGSGAAPHEAVWVLQSA